MRANLVEEGALLDLQLVEARDARVRSQLLHLPILAAVFALRFSDFFSFFLGRQVFLAFFLVVVLGILHLPVLAVVFVFHSEIFMVHG